jgi:maleate isomerase
MSDRVLLGMLTPSSNTVLEPVTAEMLRGLPEVTAHFGRFRVTEISLGDRALKQFNNEPILAASSLLADARVGVIAWNGTSAGWLGLDADRELCATITKETSVQACTSVLALDEIFRKTGVKRFGLVTPYLHAIQERVVSTFAGIGYECAAERHLNDPGNFSFSEVSEATLEAMVREVAASRPEAITIFCTNLRGALIAERMERELGIPIYDTVATAVWKSLCMTGVDPARVKGWGRLFRDVR